MAYEFFLNDAQFDRFVKRLNTIRAEIQIVRERLGPVDKDKNLHQAITELSENIGKWQALQINAISEGFSKVADAIASLNTPAPEPSQPLEVTFVFKVANDHQDEPYSISIGNVTDAEGETLPDTRGLTVEVTSSDEAVVAAGFDPATNSGVAHFGSSGVASLNAVVKNAKGDILGSGAADFTVTTGDPAAVSDVKIAFSGITEETEEPPVE